MHAEQAVNPRRVLVVGSDHRIALAIARSLHPHGYVVDVAFPRSTATGSHFIQNIRRVPKLEHGRALKDRLLELVQQHGYQVLVPCNDLVLNVFFKYYEELSAVCKLSCAPPEILNTVLDKSITIEAAQKIGLKCPQSAVIHSHELDQATLDIPFPIVCKPMTKHTRSKIKVIYFETEQEFVQKKSFLKSAASSYLVQEYCPGVGVGVELLMDQESVVAAFQHQRIEELPASGGVSVLAQAVPLNPELYEQSVALLKLLKWQGPAMVEYRLDLKTGNAVLMEVNGRFWGSLALSCDAGLNFPLYQMQLLYGENPNPVSEYIHGTKIAWTAGRIERWLKAARKSPPVWITEFSPLDELKSLWRFRPGKHQVKDPVWRKNDLPAGRAEIQQILIKVKSALPIPNALQAFLKMSGKAKKRFLKNATGRRGKMVFNDPVDQVLIVCHGNIIRSAFAEYLLREYLRDQTPQIKVVSAGTAASADSADSLAIEVGQTFAVSLDAHVPRRVDQELINQSSLVLAMDNANLANLQASYPNAWDKLFLYGEFAGDELGTRHAVRDPYNASEERFKETYNQLADLTKKVAARLQDGPNH